MALIDIRLEIPDLAAKIEEAGKLALEVEEPLKAVAKQLKEDQEARFSAGDFPPPLKPATIKRKVREGYPATALTRTGALRNHMMAEVQLAAAVLRPGPDERWYARFLQDGTGALPARPLFRIEDPEAILEVYEKAMEGPVRRANALLS